MAVHDFHSLRIETVPDETNPPLIIDADALLARAVAFEGFQAVAGRRKQVAQRPRPVQIFQLATGGVLNFQRQLAGAFAVQYPLCLAARKGGYHSRILSHLGNMSSCETATPLRSLDEAKELLVC